MQTHRLSSDTGIRNILDQWKRNQTTTDHHKGKHEIFINFPIS